MFFAGRHLDLTEFYVWDFGTFIFVAGKVSIKTSLYAIIPSKFKTLIFVSYSSWVHWAFNSSSWLIHTDSVNIMNPNYFVELCLTTHHSAIEPLILMQTVHVKWTRSKRFFWQFQSLNLSIIYSTIHMTNMFACVLSYAEIRFTLC